MKLHILSDIHSEFGPRRWAVPEVDVILLAGDIGRGLAGLEYARSTFPDHPVLYIAGNHEYYGESLPKLTQELRAAADGTHVRFMENDEVVLGGVRFLGCTLWTDFLLMGEASRAVAMIESSARLNDYRRIRKSPEFRRLKPLDLAEVHAHSRNWLSQRLAEPFAGPTVIMTHHAPSIRSLSPDRIANLVDASYASHLEHLMDGVRLPLWVHGHTHYCVDYRLNETRVLSNAAGYPGDEDTNFDPTLVVEIPA